MQNLLRIDIHKMVYGISVEYNTKHIFSQVQYLNQYATSFASSLAIYSKVKNKEENAFENYLKLLKAGGSTYPVDIIKGAGVDLTNK